MSLVHLIKFLIYIITINYVFFCNFLDPRLKQLSEDKMNEWRAWFDSRLDNAIEAAETQDNTAIESN